MDTEANSLLAIMRTRSLPEVQILDCYAKLKADIKHRAVPESAIAPLFELVRLALESPNYFDAGLSMLTHLVKRLQGQLQSSILDAQAQRIVPILVERLGSAKDRHRSRARQALVELFNVSGTISTMMLMLIENATFRSGDALAQQEAMQWVLTVHQGKGIRIVGFVPRIIININSPDRCLCRAAKACFIQLYRNSNVGTQTFMKNMLQDGTVDRAIVTHILEACYLPNANLSRSSLRYPSPPQLTRHWSRPGNNGSESNSRAVSRSTDVSTGTVFHESSESIPTVTGRSLIEPTPSLPARPASRSVSHSTETSSSTISHKPSERTNTTNSRSTIEPLPFVAAKSKAEQEAEKLDPVYVDSARDVDNLFREMLPHFEGAETEQNWKHREQSVLKVRKITKGNAYDDYPTAYLAGIKSLLNGLIGVAESLRTTQCTLGCHCIEDVARRTGPSLDPMVEILLQSLVKLCGQTKKITAANGDTSVTCIISHISFNVRVAQHIYGATQDKNVSPRLFACGWLMTILTKYGHHKSVIEHNGALDLVNKSIVAGLMDKDATVRARMRPTYWAFARLWNDKSERYYLTSLPGFVMLADSSTSILLSLEKKQQSLLLKDANNPFPDTSSVAAALGEEAAALSQSTSAVPTRPSVRETMARNRANRHLPAARPSSAGPTISPTRAASTQVPVKPATSGLTTRRPLNSSTSGNLSSAPVRPNRTFRRPELPRPATADPSSQRPRHDARSGTPAARRSKTPVAPPTAKKSNLATSKPTSQPASPTKTVQRRNSWSDDLPGGPLELGPSVRNIDNQAIEDHDDAKPNIEENDMLLRRPTQEVADPLPILTNAGNVQETSEKPDEDVFSNLSVSLTAVAARQTRGESVSPRMLPTRGSDNQAKEPDIGVLSRRLSQSPRDIQILSPRKRAQLQVYEDPEAMSTGLLPKLSPVKSAVLSDLPINAPPLNPNHLLIVDEPDNSTYHAKWTAFETSERRLSSTSRLSEAIKYLASARRLLESAIEQLRGGKLEVHVLRRIQYIVREQDQILQDACLLDDLLLTLLDAIERPRDISKQPQILITIRQLLSQYPQQCSALYSRALCAITIARAGHPSSHRIVSGLEATAESIVAQCEPTENIDSVLDLLYDESLDPHSRFMALYNLAGLLSKAAELRRLPLHESSEQRIGELIGQCINDHSTDIRRGIVEVSVQFHRCVKPEERFWLYITGSRVDCRSLITYYLVRSHPQQD